MVAGQGTLTLNPGSINKLKAKDRQAADVLMDAGLVEVHWITNENDIKRYLCPSISCKDLFPELYLLKNHFFSIHKSRPFKCTFNGCRWSFNTRSRLERHKNSHYNIKEFKCENESCGKMFTTMYNLRQHLKNIHERGEKFLCTVEGCNAGFHNQRNLDLHKATHENTERSYSCDQEGCNKTFVTKNALCSHMRSHEHDPEDLTCSWKGCNKVFELPCRLKEHMRVHTGEKPYRCDHPGCGWSFYTGSKLQRHRNKHLQIRKFVCTIDNCNKSFFRSQHLRDHESTHAKKNLSKYSCPKEDCDCKFEFKRQLFLHMKKSHKKEKSERQKRRDRHKLRERMERRERRARKEREETGETEESEETEERDESEEREERKKRKERRERKAREEREEKIEKNEKTHPKNKLHNYFEMKTFNSVRKDESRPQFDNTNQSINQLDTDNLLTGDYDVSPTENVPLNTHMPELVSSELLVAMNSIESPNNDSLPDLSPMDSCSNHSLVNTTPEETNNNEAVVINDNNVRFDHSSSPNKLNNKRKSGNSGSARTNYTYKDIMKEKQNGRTEQEEIKRSFYSTDAGNDEPRPKILKNVIYSKQSEDLQNCKLSIPSDLVLGPGMNDHHSLIVQDELYTQEDLQVLLLDQSTLKNPIFEPSTINLRDLE